MQYLFVFLLIVVVWTLCLVYYLQRKDLLYKLAALFVITCVCEFLKRFIYIFGDIGSIPYYIVLFIPDSIILLDIVISRKFRKPLLFLIFFVFLMSVVAMLYGQSIMQVVIMVRTVFLPITLMFLVSGSSINKALPYAKTINISHVLIVVSLSSLYGAYQFFFDYPFWEYNWDLYSPANMSLTQITRHGEVQRGFGFFSEVSGQGMAASIAMIYVMYTFNNYVLKYIILLILLIGLITSFSKTAFVAFFVALFIWKLVFFVRRWILLLASLGLIALANSREVIYTLIEFVRRNFSGVLLSGLDPATLLSRVTTINEFLDNMSVTSFFLGGGFGYEGGITMDNLFVYIMYKCGLLGLLLFGYFVNKYMVNSLAIDKQSKFVFVALLFILIFSMTTINVTARSGLLMMLIVFEVARRRIDFNTYYRRRLRCVEKKRVL